MLFVLDRNWNVVEANPAFERLFGMEEGDWQDKPLDALIFAADAERVRKDLESAWTDAGDGSATTVARFAAPPGEAHWTEWSAAVSKWKRKRALFVVARDLTIERQQDERFRLVVEGAPNGIVMTDAEGRLVLVNRQAEQMFGYSRDELVGQRIEILLPERSRKAHVSLREAFVKEPEARPMGAGRDLYALRKNGEEFPVEVGLTPIEMREGRFVLGVIVDITERKKAEAALRSYAEELKRSNRELQEFASVASHDLKEPLRKISMFGDRLLAQHAADLSPTAQDYLGRMVAGANRMKRLIDDLLAFSRLGNRALTRERIDLNGLVRDVIGDLQLAVEDSGAVIHVGDLPQVAGDASQLRQLLQNLLENAIKFRRKDVPLVIRVEGQADRGRVTLTVEDNGVGFDMKYHDRIFTIFQRLHGREGYGGSGVGLAICRKIAECHGGSISAQSRPGEGARFSVQLPQAL